MSDFSNPLNQAMLLGTQTVLSGNVSWALPSLLRAERSDRLCRLTGINSILIAIRSANPNAPIATTQHNPYAAFSGPCVDLAAGMDADALHPEIISVSVLFICGFCL